MRKPIMAVLMTVILMVTVLSGCGNGAQGAAEESVDKQPSGTEDVQGTEVNNTEDQASGVNGTRGTKKIGVSDQTSGAEWNLENQQSIRDIFEADGYEVTVLSCEGSATQQVTDIENLVTAGCEYIFVSPVDQDSAYDALKAAQEQGVKIFSMQPFTDESKQDCVDVALSLDFFEVGVDCAEYLSDWVNENYSDAEDGSVECIIIENRADPTNIARSDGYETISEINAKIKMVDAHDVGLNANANAASDVQAYMEQAIVKYPDVKVFIVNDVNWALAVNEVVMQYENDYSKMCIVACGASEAGYAALEESKEDKNILRILCANQDVGDLCYEGWQRILDGTLPEDKLLPWGTIKVTADNVDEFK